MVEMIGVSLDISAEGDRAGAVVGTLTEECVIGQQPEQRGPLPAADVEEGESVFDGLVVVMEAFDVGRFVGVEKGRIVFSEDSLHAVDRDGVAIGQVDDQFLNRPGAGPGASKQVFAREPGNCLPELLAAVGVGFDQERFMAFPSIVVCLFERSLQVHASGTQETPTWFRVAKRVLLRTREPIGARSSIETVRLALLRWKEETAHGVAYDGKEAGDTLWIGIRILDES